MSRVTAYAERSGGFETGSFLALLNLRGYAVRRRSEVEEPGGFETGSFLALLNLRGYAVRRWSVVEEARQRRLETQ